MVKKASDGPLLRESPWKKPAETPVQPVAAPVAPNMTQESPATLSATPAAPTQPVAPVPVPAANPAPAPEPVTAPATPAEAPVPADLPPAAVMAAPAPVVKQEESRPEVGSLSEMQDKLKVTEEQINPNAIFIDEDGNLHAGAEPDDKNPSAA